MDHEQHRRFLRRLARVTELQVKYGITAYKLARMIARNPKNMREIATLKTHLYLMEKGEHLKNPSDVAVRRINRAYELLMDIEKGRIPAPKKERLSLPQYSDTHRETRRSLRCRSPRPPSRLSGTKRRRLHLSIRPPSCRTTTCCVSNCYANASSFKSSLLRSSWCKRRWEGPMPSDLIERIDKALRTTYTGTTLATGPSRRYAPWSKSSC